MILRQPRTFTIDLSSVEVDKPFTLQAFAMATAYNRIAGPPSEFGSSATAFLQTHRALAARPSPPAGWSRPTCSASTRRPRPCRARAVPAELDR